MDEAARQYARRVLLLHLILLVAVITLVALAAYEVYIRTRDQVVAQAETRQELLARQTASAIESFYASIASDLRFLQQSEDTPATSPSDQPAPGRRERSDRPLANLLAQADLPPPPRLVRPLWNQLDGRVSAILYIARPSGAVVHAFPEGVDRDLARRAIQPFADWLRDLNGVSISPFRPTRDGGANLVAVPLSRTYVLAAVVPVDMVERRFLDVVSRDRSSLGALVDETGLVMATSDLAGQVFVPLPGDPAASQPMRRSIRRVDTARLTPGTVEHRDPITAPDTNVTVPPRLTTVEPLTVADRTFYVVIVSRLADVTAAINTMYARAFVGAVVVILSVTAILLSTALRLIRSRQRLETVRHEMLTRELDQARQIQLNWLPPAGASSLPSIRLAAVNHPASHISGDFYDWFVLPDGRTVVTIGDVTGHGMPAAFLMATVQLLVRTTMPRVPSPGVCLEEVNRQLCHQPFHGQFITILLLVIDARAATGLPGAQAQTLALATAGHMPPLLAPNAQPFRPLPVEPQLPLGIDADATYPSEEFSLSSDATLVLYTDGVPDAQAPDDTRFDLPRILTALVSASSRDPQALIDQLVSAVSTFRLTRPLGDDLTLVALTLAPASVKAGPVPQDLLPAST